MLGKRARSVQRDQQMGQASPPVSSWEVLNLEKSHAAVVQNNNNNKNKSFFNLPGIFVGLNPKGLSDSDSARSPTSPLDFRAFPSLTSPVKSPKSPQCKKIWDCGKVGLSIVDSLDGAAALPGEVFRSSDSKTILFGPRMRVKCPKFDEETHSVEVAKSLPNNYAFAGITCSKSPVFHHGSDVVFEIGDPIDSENFVKTRSSSLDSCTLMKSPSNFSEFNVNQKASNFSCAPNNPSTISASFGSGKGIIMPIPTREIELSEDYTCVIVHGPYQKTTHIFGDCILECQSNNLTDFEEAQQNSQLSLLDGASETPAALYPSHGFLNSCCTCKKILGQGKDIYIYRGEKAFCSYECRSKEIMIDEEMVRTAKVPSPENENYSDSYDGQDELFETPFEQAE